jgi:hypothetical protein
MPPADPSPRPDKLRVLVVDDEKNIRITVLSNSAAGVRELPVLLRQGGCVGSRLGIVLNYAVVCMIEPTARHRS